MRAAKRGAWVALSSGVQALLVVAVIAISTKIAADVANAPVVDVKFVKQAAPPPPPPPPAPRRKTPPRPKADTPKPRPPNPMAMVQPKEVPQELKPPDPSEAPEPEYDEGPDTGTEGVVGGVAGSTGAAPQGGAVEDAPVYASAGFKAASEAQPRCVASNVRVPRDLAGIVSRMTVKFAVNRDGSVANFQVMGSQPDPRIGQVVWQAIQSCRFNPGADAQGRPVNMWVILPLVFTAG
ncbi:MAG: TonB family protein [Myxococcales bacterium]